MRGCRCGCRGGCRSAASPSTTAATMRPWRADSERSRCGSATATAGRASDAAPSRPTRRLGRSRCRAVARSPSLRPCGCWARHAASSCRSWSSTGRAPRRCLRRRRTCLVARGARRRSRRRRRRAAVTNSSTAGQTTGSAICFSTTTGGPTTARAAVGFTSSTTRTRNDRRNIEPWPRAAIGAAIARRPHTRGGGRTRRAART